MNRFFGPKHPGPSLLHKDESSFWWYEELEDNPKKRYA
jgi:hypothetical protein